MGVYSPLFCSMISPRESHMIPSTNSTLPFQLVTGSSVAFIWLTIYISDGSNNELQDLTNLLIASAAHIERFSTQEGAISLRTT